MHRAVGGDAREGGALCGGEVPGRGVLPDDGRGDDRALVVVPCGERPDGVAVLHEEPEVPVEVRVVLGAAEAAFGGVADPVVQVAQEIGALDQDGGEGHRGAHDDQGGADEEEEPGAE